MWNFIKSSSNKHNWLEHNKGEICFFGRSNVGKSSFINSLANNKKLAKVSKTPGRTQLINYFDFNEKLIVVDLPGYGFAKLSKQKKEEMHLMIDEYLRENSKIKMVFLLFDSKVGFLKEDREVFEYISKIGLPLTLIGTKIDKLNQSSMAKLKKEELLLSNQYFLISSYTKKNIDKVLMYINNSIL
ncbi:MAG: ribosome biogenesis GTP-binding protein YihA/YsxC [Metamycoplasmataceae bacterium]